MLVNLGLQAQSWVTSRFMMSKAKNYFWGFVIVAIIFSIFYFSKNNNSSSSSNTISQNANTEPNLIAISKKCNLPIKRSHALRNTDAIIKIGFGKDFQKAASCVINQFPSAEENQKKLENILYKNGDPSDSSEDNNIVIYGDSCSLSITPTFAGCLMLVGDIKSAINIDKNAFAAELTKDITENYDYDSAN